jgi:sorting nexin-27
MMQEFLSTSQDDTTTPGSDADPDDGGGSSSEVELKVLLPDRAIVTVSIKRNATTEQVYQGVVKKLAMCSETAEHFALFELEEYNFERKLQANEFPHNLYIQNYSTATATCITLRKWLFSIDKEMSLCDDSMPLNFFFWQAVDEVSRGQIKASDKSYELKSLQESGKMKEYLKLARQFDGYGELAFPHCACDSRKEGHVIAKVGANCFKLQACKEDGTPESQVIEFAWRDIQQWEADDEGMSFNFEYIREGKKPRWVKIYSSYFIYLYESFERIKTELSWETEVCV